MEVYICGHEEVEDKFTQRIREENDQDLNQLAFVIYCFHNELL